MAELSRPDQIPALKAIWAASFPEDSHELIDRAFGRLYRPADCMVECRAGRPVSMAFLLPAVWHNGTSTYPVQYIYAAATLPAYRGQGLFGALLRQAHEEASRRGQAASFLRPGEPSLTAYYRRFGYENWFTAAVLRLSREELAALGGRAAGIARFSSCPDYGARRDALLAAHPCWIRWEERLARQAVDTASGVLIGPDGCALCERAGDTLLVRELLCPPERLADYGRALLECFPSSRYEIVRPADETRPGEASAMWRPLSDAARRPAGPPYLGLTLE